MVILRKPGPAAGLDKMTIYDYHIVMIPVNIATLKAKLSFYLGRVKQGNEVLVMDRNTPVARLVPSAGGGQSLVLTQPENSPSALRGMKASPPKRRFNVTRLLREERDRR